MGALRRRHAGGVGSPQPGAALAAVEPLWLRGEDAGRLLHGGVFVGLGRGALVSAGAGGLVECSLARKGPSGPTGSRGAGPSGAITAQGTAGAHGGARGGGGAPCRRAHGRGG